MLVFQIDSLAPQRQRVADGTYDIPIRLSDGGDCFSTIPIPNPTPVHQFGASLRVHVFSMKKQLMLDEPGAAVSLILVDIERVKRGDVSNDTLFGDSISTPVAGLVLLRYEAGAAYSKDAVWVLQRELRRASIDFCVDESAVLVGYSAKAGQFGLETIPLNLVGRFDTLADRDGSLIDRSALQEKSALIIGLGSVGSVIASELARSGVGRFSVADKERLEWGNIVRHAAGLSDVGRLKSRIVADLIKDRNPNAQVLEISSELGSASKETYDRAVASADVVICATDNRASRLICNRLCIKYHKKVIFGGLSSGAYAGMVFQCQSPETMCYHCFVSSFPEAAADRENSESEYSGGPDGHLALDIAPITNLMSKLALVELQRQVGIVPNGLDTDLSAPWYLWINRRQGEYEGLAPLGSPAKGPQVLQWHPVSMDKIEECPHCGTKPNLSVIS